MLIVSVLSVVVVDSVLSVVVVINVLPGQFVVSCGGCQLWWMSEVKLFLFFCVHQNQKICMISFQVLYRYLSLWCLQHIYIYIYFCRNQK